MKKSKLSIILIVGLVLVAGATYLVWSNVGKPADEIEVAKETVLPEATQDLSAETASITETPAVLASPDNSAEEVVKPTPKNELAGTEPGSVNLASGGLQLVEIFAFW